MSNRNYVKVAFVDHSQINEFGDDLAKLVFIMTKEWANTMSIGVSQLLDDPETLNNMSDAELAATLDSMSEEVLESIAMGIQIGAGNNMQVVNVIMERIIRSINTKVEMEEVIAARSPGLALSIALEHNYPYIIMKAVNASDIEYGLHFDLHTREVFFVVENKLQSALDALAAFPLDAEDRKALEGEDFYAARAANDEVYGSDDTPDPVGNYKSMLREFENMHNAHFDTLLQDDEDTNNDDEVVEQTQEIEYAARVFNIFGDLEDERTGHAGQLEDLISWASSVAKLDGLRYDIFRIVTTTRVSVNEESILA